MGRVLAATVVVEDPGTRESVSLPAGSELPDWAAELVTNPAAFVDESEPAALPPVTEVDPYAGRPLDPLHPDDQTPSAFDVDLSGTIANVLDRVNDDPDTASRYYHAEMAQGDPPRKTLLERLNAIITDAE